ncbi:MAG: hypothetical protein HFJ33_06885 [Clostridia bacterium]|nr:hypothetical protein [Clostridia bacterium]
MNENFYQYKILYEIVKEENGLLKEENLNLQNKMRQLEESKKQEEKPKKNIVYRGLRKIYHIVKR